MPAESEWHMVMRGDDTQVQMKTSTRLLEPHADTMMR